MFPVLDKKDEYHCRIQRISVTPGSRFYRRQTTFDLLSQICPERVFSVQNRKSELYPAYSQF